jgi:hypothetical protein
LFFVDGIVSGLVFRFPTRRKRLLAMTDRRNKLLAVTDSRTMQERSGNIIQITWLIV